MWKKLLRKKNVAILLGAVPIVTWSLPFLLLWYYGGVFSCTTECENILAGIGIATLSVAPLLFTLLISIPAFFMRDEVHSFWFKWMMVRYMPVACILTFLMASAESGEGSGWGPSVHGIGTIFSIVIFSALFIVLSVLLIIARYVSLRREKSNGFR